MWVDVQIEPCDVTGSRRGDCLDCPAARRITRLLGDEWRAFVGKRKSDLVWEFGIIPRKDKWVGIFNIQYNKVPPAALIDYAEAYDYHKRGKPPEPISVRLNIPKRFLRSTP